MFVSGVVVHSVCHYRLIDVQQDSVKADFVYIFQQWVHLLLRVARNTKRRTHKLGHHIPRYVSKF